MANLFTTQVLEDGPRNTLLKVTITSDGSGESTDVVLYDASAYINGNTTRNKIKELMYMLHSFSATLYWDATANVQICNLAADRAETENFDLTGGLPNNGAAGRTGDILITTQGLASAPIGTTGEIIIRVQKKAAK